jgi:hypothetical protein
MDPATSLPGPRPALTRALFWGGLLLSLLAIALCVAQYAVARSTITPWYLPALTTVGALALLAAVRRRRSVGSVIVFLVVAMLAGFEWFFLAGLSRLPAYHGPVTVGQPMPAFETRLADGQPFTQRDLARGQASVMTFFRGRW